MAFETLITISEKDRQTGREGGGGGEREGEGKGQRRERRGKSKERERQGDRESRRVKGDPSLMSQLPLSSLPGSSTKYFHLYLQNLDICHV